MEPGTLNFGQGRIQYFDLLEVDFTRSPHDQIDKLKEDLVQVEYKGGILLDIGWYPSFSPKGSFVVTVIQEPNWEEPLFETRCYDMESLKAAVRRAVSVAQTSSFGAQEDVDP